MDGIETETGTSSQIFYFTGFAGHCMIGCMFAQKLNGIYTASSMQVSSPAETQTAISRHAQFSRFGMF